MAQAILTRLTLTPYSVDELADDLKAHPAAVRRVVTGLIAGGDVVFLQGRPSEGGPFFCLPGYRETMKTFDKTEAYFRRSYALFYTGDDLD